MLEAMLISVCFGLIGLGIYHFIDRAPWTDAADARYVAELKQQEYEMYARWAREDAERGRRSNDEQP